MSSRQGALDLEVHNLLEEYRLGHRHNCLSTTMLSIIKKGSLTQHMLGYLQAFWTCGLTALPGGLREIRNQPKVTQPVKIPKHKSPFYTVKTPYPLSLYGRALSPAPGPLWPQQLRQEFSELFFTWEMVLFWPQFQSTIPREHIHPNHVPQMQVMHIIPGKYILGRKASRDQRSYTHVHTHTCIPTHTNIYSHTYVHTYTFSYTITHTYIYIHAYLHMRNHIHMHSYTHIHTCIGIHSCTYIHTQSRMYTYICTCIPTHRYTYIHI